MKKQRLLVVDDNLSLIQMIREYAKGSNKLEVVKEAHDGEEGFNILKDNLEDIDLILLDLIMPNKDGLYFLDKMKEEKIDKSVIVLTSFNADDMIRRVSSYDIKYFLLKPFDLSDLEQRILEATNQIETNNNSFYDQDLKISVTKLLHELGVPSHIKGYQYIRDGILILYNNPSIVGGITKELYPEIANRFNTSVSRVERAIRHAIEVSWNRGNIELMEEIFGHSVDYDRAKPTNSEFIVTVADKLKLEYENSKVINSR
jgi:two-component system response regulator (stage 0 sporulation protein A)